MKITALEEYGLRCMILFVKKGVNKTITLPEIAEEEKLSVPYAGKLLMILKQAGLVNAVRGRKGGYKLSKPPEETPLKEIFDALGEPIYGPHHCRRYNADGVECVHNDDCSVRHMWYTFDRFIGSFLENVTLADLVSGNYKLMTRLNRDPLENPIKIQVYEGK